MNLYHIDIGNGCEPMQMEANSRQHAADMVFANLSTNVCSIREDGKEAWWGYSAGDDDDRKARADAAEGWQEAYAKMPDFEGAMDHDHSMDY